MAPLILGLLLLAACVDATGTGGETVAGLADVPLMPGLDNDPGGSRELETPKGPAIEAFAKGAVDRYTVVRFYHRALPRLGWRDLSLLYFVRNGETLRITLTGQDGELRVRFLLGPR